MKVITKLYKKKKDYKECCKKLYIKKLDSLDERDKFLEKYKLLKLTIEEIENKNKCVIRKEI